MESEASSVGHLRQHEMYEYVRDVIAMHDLCNRPFFLA